MKKDTAFHWEDQRTAASPLSALKIPSAVQNKDYVPLIKIGIYDGFIYRNMPFMMVLYMEWVKIPIYFK